MKDSEEPEYKQEEPDMDECWRFCPPTVLIPGEAATERYHRAIAKWGRRILKSQKKE